jgi:hypothetical protein
VGVVGGSDLVKAKEQLGEDYLDIVDWCVCLLHAAVVRARGVGRRHAWEHVGAADLKACSGPHACAHSRARTHTCCAPCCGWASCRAFPENGLNAFKDGKSIAVQSFKARECTCVPLAVLIGAGRYRAGPTVAPTPGTSIFNTMPDPVAGLSGRRETQEAPELAPEISGRA